MPNTQPLPQLAHYRCPVCKAHLEPAESGADHALQCATGHRFAVRDGIVDFTVAQTLSAEQNDSVAYYQNTAGLYDQVADLSFRIQRQDEQATRAKFADLLRLRPNSRVLEIACGTGRDSVHIIERLGEGGALHAMDLSPAMLMRCRDKLRGQAANVEFAVGGAAHLPYADGYFDAVFSFGGLNVFGDLSACFREMVRVSKPGARVVVGDESLAPWLYDSEYGRILLANNPLFRHPLPLASLPVEARQVRVQWVIGGVYYLIDFDVGTGEPEADFDLEIPGERGGTLRTRYYGKMEGVRPPTLELARAAQRKSGKSMHHWLDEVVQEAALRQLNLGKPSP